jgi:hypothetical protein
MPVNSAHPDFDHAFPHWRRCRDAYAGTDAVKAATLANGMTTGQSAFQPGQRMAQCRSYLPQLDGQDAAQYIAYVERALWYGATKRTVQGLTGAIFRKEPTIDVPESIQSQMDDITMDGDVTLAEFAKKILEELLVVGRVGALVDMSPDAVAPADRRPYWVQYSAEQIINWKTQRVNGKTVLSLVVLEESVDIADEDEFEHASETQYRVLKLDEQYLYTVEIWKQVTTKDANGKDTQSFELDQAYAPTNMGKRLDFIPFVFFAANGLSSGIDTPPLLDLVDVNLSHYRSTADYEHGLHYTALPTPWITGAPEQSSFSIGPANAWTLTNVDAKVGMLEFTGQGLKPLADAIKEKETKMAALGARLLEAPKAGVEAADTVRLRQSGEQGALASIAATLSQGLTKALGWHASWAGADPAAVHVEVNKDFFDVEMPAPLLQQLLGALQAGAISYETFYYNLQKGEIARPGVDADEEQKLIESQQEPLDVTDANANPANPDDEGQGDPVVTPDTGAGGVTVRG